MHQVCSHSIENIQCTRLEMLLLLEVGKLYILGSITEFSQVKKTKPDSCCDGNLGSYGKHSRDSDLVCLGRQLGQGQTAGQKSFSEDYSSAEK